MCIRSNSLLLKCVDCTNTTVTDALLTPLVCNLLQLIDIRFSLQLPQLGFLPLR